MSAFYLGTGDLNSGPHAFQGSVLATEPSPSPIDDCDLRLLVSCSLAFCSLIHLTPLPGTLPWEQNSEVPFRPVARSTNVVPPGAHSCLLCFGLTALSSRLSQHSCPLFSIHTWNSHSARFSVSRSSLHLFSLALFSLIPQ